MAPSYYRIQQNLINLIESSLDKTLDVDEAEVIYQKLLSIMDDACGKWMDELNDVANEFRVWLDDIDVRQRDKSYARSTTDKLRNWCKQNKIARDP